MAWVAVRYSAPRWVDGTRRAAHSGWGKAHHGDGLDNIHAKYRRSGLSTRRHGSLCGHDPISPGRSWKSREHTDRAHWISQYTAADPPRPMAVRPPERR